jgi:hypothetical protein
VFVNYVIPGVISALWRGDLVTGGSGRAMLPS